MIPVNIEGHLTECYLLLATIKKVTGIYVTERIHNAWKVIDDQLYIIYYLGTDDWVLWSYHITSVAKLGGFAVITTNHLIEIYDSNKNHGITV